jgi:hypothetical protein
VKSLTLMASPEASTSKPLGPLDSWQGNMPPVHDVLQLLGR